MLSSDGLAVCADSTLVDSLSVLSDSADGSTDSEQVVNEELGRVLCFCGCHSTTAARATRVLRRRSRGNPQLAADVTACLCEELLGDACRHVGDAAKRRRGVLSNEKSFWHAVFCTDRAVSSHGRCAACGSAPSADCAKHFAFAKGEGAIGTPYVPRLPTSVSAPTAIMHLLYLLCISTAHYDVRMLRDWLWPSHPTHRSKTHALLERS